MTALDRIHRFNTCVVKAVTLVGDIIYQTCAVAAGAILIFFAWWMPRHYGLQLLGWWRLLPYGVMAFGAFGIWEGIARIIALTRSPPAPPPTTPGTW